MKKDRKYELAVVLLVTLISYGFMMDFQWPWAAKKDAKKTSQSNSAPAKSSAATVMPSTQKEEGMKISASDKNFAEQAKGEAASSNTNEAANTNGEESFATEQEIVKVQKDLRDILRQTKVIQPQNTADRVVLQKVLTQAKVQKQLINTIKVPATNIVSKSVANPDEIIRATKVRLIAEDVKRTQQTLKQIQPVARAQTPSIPSMNKIPKKVST